MQNNKPLHTEPRAARFGDINVVRRGPVNGGVTRQNPLSSTIQIIFGGAPFGR